MCSFGSIILDNHNMLLLANLRQNPQYVYGLKMCSESKTPQQSKKYVSFATIKVFLLYGNYRQDKTKQMARAK